MSELPKVGEVWERDGLKRHVHRVLPIAGQHEITWTAPQGIVYHRIRAQYWARWASKATKVSES